MEHVTHNIIKKILLSGGGTGGSVSPLLAIAESLSPQPPLLIRRGGELGGEAKFLWLGTKNGPEREMVEKEAIEFKAIYGGKLSRYFSLRNFIAPIFIIAGFVQSFFIILKWKPDLVISAGSFVSVPVVWAAWILRVPILVHQQDVRPGLANKLMAPLAKIITVTFEESLKDYGRKAVWTGNPARQFSIFPASAGPRQGGGNFSRLSGTPPRRWQFSIKEIRKKFGFNNNLPVILVIGGGTGAMAINELVWKSLDELIKFCRIIHITGKNKKNYELRITNYESFEFLNAEQMAESYAAADIVVSRAGMGVLTELSYLGKPSILIPMPDSHQEENAEIFKQKKAAVVLNQKELAAETLYVSIKKLLADEKLRAELSKNIREVIKRGANEEMVKLINNVLKS